MKELEKLIKEAIKHGAKSEIVKPKFIMASNLDKSSPAWTELTLLKEQENINGYKLENEKAILYPIEPHADYYGQLYHKGLLFIKGGYNNLINLKEKGVFGSPEKNKTTYLMKGGTNIRTFNHKNGFRRIRLWINKKELMKKRSIFLDPETIKENYFHEKIGDSYFILGGIPRESIANFVVEE